MLKTQSTEQFTALFVGRAPNQGDYSKSCGQGRGRGRYAGSRFQGGRGFVPLRPDGRVVRPLIS